MLSASLKGENRMFLVVTQEDSADVRIEVVENEKDLLKEGKCRVIIPYDTEEELREEIERILGIWFED